MSASLMLGKECAAYRIDVLKKKIIAHINNGLRVPELAVILLGDNPASKIYVENKRKACLEAGIISHAYNLPANTNENSLIELINELNNSIKIDGILIQLPLPEHINTAAILEHIVPHKDVDGFHPYNLGRLAQKNPVLRPCTPLGIMNLLEYYQLAVKGKFALVIGASNIVGRPMALELLLAGATVVIANSHTNNLQFLVESAEIIVVATGVQDIVATDWLKPHQIVIDVGMHRLTNGRLRGDVDFKAAQDKVAWITPVPNGVGPMTIVTLLENTFFAMGLKDELRNQ